MAEGAANFKKGFAVGDVIAEKYVLQQPLARGGMGTVWVAQNKLTERRVAIKFMLPELASTPETLERFFREAKASARIDHPCIVDVLDLGTLEDEAPFMVMEFLEGRSLEGIIEASPITPVQAAAVMLDVCNALAAAHTVGIVHRDLKPANIFVAKRGESLVPKILDFGISKITSAMGDIRMTRTGAVLGSPAYMSPEQARGRSDIDGRADIWAVGVILYEAVSGKLPFNGENYNQVMMSITLDPATPLSMVAPHVDKDFLALVEACLQKDRDQRPANMEALAGMLDAYVAPRAADGIPPLDIGETSSDARSVRTPGYKPQSYAVPRARPAAGALAPLPTKPPEPAQMTMGAVTVVDPPRSSKRGLIGVAAAVGFCVVAGVGWFVIKGQNNKTRAVTTASTTAATSAPIPSATSEIPSATATAIPSASDSAQPTASAVPSASASASAKPAPSMSAIKLPPKLPIGPKPKGSESDGPANVGTGPGF